MLSEFCLVSRSHNMERTKVPGLEIHDMHSQATPHYLWECNWSGGSLAFPGKDEHATSAGVGDG
jgi:hypothetical protein